MFAQARLQVVNARGLHARAATRLSEVASNFASEVELEKDGQCVDAKSIMGILLLCGQRGSFVTVRVRGTDADDALDAITALFASGFGEED